MTAGGHNKKDLIGLSFDLLTVIEEGETYISPKGKKERRVLCKCECGNVIEKRISSLRRKNKNPRSCGCSVNRSMMPFYSENPTKNITWNSWRAMKDRCDNPKANFFHHYGGAGITYCDRWNKYENFLEDMGERPDVSLTIDRVDNNLGYFKENCRWATWETQNDPSRKRVHSL